MSDVHRAVVGSFAVLGVAVAVGCGEVLPDADGPGAGTSDAGGVDGARPADAASGSVDPGIVGNQPVTYGECRVLVPCNAPIEGTWKVAGGCMGTGSFARARAQCAKVTEHDVEVKAGGTLVIRDGVIESKTTVSIEASLTFPSTCVTAGGGCEAIAQRLKSEEPGPPWDAADCVPVLQQGCECRVRLDTTDRSSAQLTLVSTGVLEAREGNSVRTFEYCGEPGRLSYRQTAPSTALEITYDLLP